MQQVIIKCCNNCIETGIICVETSISVNLLSWLLFSLSVCVGWGIWSGRIVILDLLHIYRYESKNYVYIHSFYFLMFYRKL